MCKYICILYSCHQKTTELRVFVLSFKKYIGRRLYQYIEDDYSLDF